MIQRLHWIHKFLKVMNQENLASTPGTGTALRAAASNAAALRGDTEDKALASTAERSLGATDRDQAAVNRFVERFASVLVEAGIPRMPARVFAALLAADSGRLTAAELSEQLQASPAAVSGGVRYLIGVGMVSREGEPGSRRHYYHVPDNVWDEVISGRDRVMAKWTAVLRDGVETVGAETPAGARLAESVQYFEFVSAELPRVLARWQERKAALARGAGARP
jgi:DNA-binding transcriptional regulator GbsR (MarR family)